MYRVIKFFTDLQDSNHAYYPGDKFPREGAEASEERIAELSGSENKRGAALIEAEKKTEEPKTSKPKGRGKKNAN